jgi:glutamate-1-semialdehyde 2,1-aminomutase
MEAKTRVFVDDILAFAKEEGIALTIPTIGSIFWLAFTEDRIISADQIDPASMEKFKVLHHELLQRGVYLGPSGYEVGFVSAAHTEEDLKIAAGIMKECLKIVFNK